MRLYLPVLSGEALSGGGIRAPVSLRTECENAELPEHGWIIYVPFTVSGRKPRKGNSRLMASCDDSIGDPSYPHNPRLEDKPGEKIDATGSTACKEKTAGVSVVANRYEAGDGVLQPTG